MGDTLSPDDWESVCKKQVELALGGNQEAAEWCARHRPLSAPIQSPPVIPPDLSNLTEDQLRALVGNTPGTMSDDKLLDFCVELQRRVNARKSPPPENA